MAKSVIKQRFYDWDILMKRIDTAGNLTTVHNFTMVQAPEGKEFNEELELDNWINTYYKRYRYLLLMTIEVDSHIQEEGE